MSFGISSCRQLHQPFEKRPPENGKALVQEGDEFARRAAIFADDVTRYRNDKWKPALQSVFLKIFKLFEKYLDLKFFEAIIFVIFRFQNISPSNYGILNNHLPRWD